MRRKGRKAPLPMMGGGAGTGNDGGRYEMHEESIAELPAAYEREQDMKKVDDRAAAGYDGAYRGH